MVFYEDKRLVPENLRNTVVTLRHKGHPAVKNASRGNYTPVAKTDGRHPEKSQEIAPCRVSGQNIKPKIYKTEYNQLPPQSNPNKEIQLDFIGPIRESSRQFYIL